MDTLNGRSNCSIMEKNEHNNSIKLEFLGSSYEIFDVYLIKDQSHKNYAQIIYDGGVYNSFGRV